MADKRFEHVYRFSPPPEIPAKKTDPFKMRTPTQTDGLRGGSANRWKLKSRPLSDR